MTDDGAESPGVMSLMPTSPRIGRTDPPGISPGQTGDTSRRGRGCRRPWRMTLPTRASRETIDPSIDPSIQADFYSTGYWAKNLLTQGPRVCPDTAAGRPQETAQSHLALRSLAD